MVLPGKRGRIHFFLSLTESPAFGNLPPVDLIGSVQPIYFCAGIRPPVGNKSNSRYNYSITSIIFIVFFSFISLFKY